MYAQLSVSGDSEQSPASQVVADCLEGLVHAQLSVSGDSEQSIIAL